MYLLQGIVLGFSIAAPVGPIGVLCIRRTLAHGMAQGLVSGLGAATADAIYGSIAGFGITIVSAALLHYQWYLHLAGGLFLLYLGYTTGLSVPAEAPAKAQGKGLPGAYTSTLLLTLTNPMTILSFAAIFAGLGVGNTDGTYLSALLLVSGIFIGSLLWWLTLSGIVNKLRGQFDQRKLTWVNRVSGLIIAGFGIGSLLSM